MTIKRTDGEIALDGKWAVLFKAQLALMAFIIPALIPWGAWTTVTLLELDPNSPRFTHADARVIQQQVEANSEELRLRRDTISQVGSLIADTENIRVSSERIEAMLAEQRRWMEARFSESEADMNRRVDKVEATDREFLRLLTELFGKINKL